MISRKIAYKQKMNTLLQYIIQSFINYFLCNIAIESSRFVTDICFESVMFYRVLSKQKQFWV